MRFGDEIERIDVTRFEVHLVNVGASRAVDDAADLRPNRCHRAHSTRLQRRIKRGTAQFAVIDAASLKEATLEAQQSLQQINNQVTQIQQFVHMLQNDERNLTALPFSVVAQLDQSIAQITALMGQAEGLVYNVQGVETQFQRFYPSSIGAATPDLQLASDAQTRWQYSLASFQNTMQVQSQIVQGLTADQAQMDALVAQSQGATGALQATQAGNQLIALHAKQLTALTMGTSPRPV